ncbi:N-acetylmuramoyl-L-alanine amidase [Streptococcus infantarius subsp. infantarius]|uniref:GBS Bsp-like repeat-containing protein n=1 Tax=Streptococcus infantarius TaxID=102684 RepID=UPI00208F527D|nr:GBS Bsp-like repeat-containing protein [Streptococcus infantarius]MCO4501919.1 N-acetylmuramoyl-L-alanine amidase [Streptococcus infantarius subsp. infantarius]MCY7238432.1 GBS Bsp-like repeat-containing protein [Streptococcus infantarius]
MKKNILRSCLVSPIIIGAFLSSGQVFADENTTTQSTTVTENVQSSVEQSSSLQLNSDSVISDDNETNNSLSSSEVQNESQNLTDADKQDSAIADGQEAEKNADDQTSLINPSISEDNKESAGNSEGNNVDNSAVQESQSSDDTTDHVSSKTSLSNLAESKVSTSAVQAASQKVINQLAASKAVVKEVTSATLTNKGFDIQYNQAIPAGAKIMFAVWSDTNGQDDLIWYTADSNGHVVAKYTGSYGKYNIHTYQNLNGQMTGLNGRSIDVPKPSAKVRITKVDGTIYKVTVSDVPAYITSIQLPIWTEKGGQDDIQWYATTQNTDSTFTRTFSIAEHNMESGQYNVHVYGTSAVTNSLTGLTGTSFQGDYHFGDVKVQPTLTANGIQISMPSDVSSDMTVYHAVWSAKNDQDDLIWYKVPANGQLTAKYTGDYGTYLIHTYAVIKGQMTCISATSIDVPRPSAKAKIIKESPTTYKVTITDVPVYIDSIQVPTWTEKNGQDDIQWYKATKTADGSYYVIFSEATHNLEAGTYNVHVYGNSRVTNSQTALLETRFEFDYQFGDVKVQASVDQNGINISMPSDVSSNLKVMHAVWSAKNDQDDLIWYQVPADGQLTAKYTGDYETYLIHTYAVINGQMTCISATSINVPKPEIKATVTKENDVKVKVTVSNVPVYVTGITIPVWTSLNGQDDIKWYQAIKQSDGTYILTFSPREHNFESGHYNIHIYGQSQVSHSLEALSSTSGVDLSTDKYVVAPSVTVQNHDVNGGTLKVRVAESENTKKIKSVTVAAWSESNQSNLHWYTTSDVYDGVVTVMVNEKNHGHIKGNYTVHVYVDFTDNTTSGFNLGQYALNSDEPAQHAPSYFIDISSHNGVISVSDYQRLKSQGITGVVVKLTEGTSYTNPYARAQIANAQAAGLRVSAYHYSHYETAAEARAEAQYFVRVAQSMGLSGSTTMVNDMEERSMLNGDLNANTQAWKGEMTRLGYSNNVYYTMASWLDTKGGKLNTAKFGLSNLWVAHYLYAYTYLDQESAKSLSYYSNTAAWQYTSVSPKLSHALDESIDYTGRFTW